MGINKVRITADEATARDLAAYLAEGFETGPVSEPYRNRDGTVRLYLDVIVPEKGAEE